MRFLSKLILALSGIVGILVGLVLLLYGAALLIANFSPDILAQTRDMLEQMYDQMEPTLVEQVRPTVEMFLSNLLPFGIGLAVAGLLFFIGAGIAFGANKKGRFVGVFIFAFLNVNPGYLLGGLFGLLGKKD